MAVESVGPTAGYGDSRAFLKALKHRQEARRRQQLEEAKRLEEQAKAIYQQHKRKKRAQEEHKRHNQWVARISSDLGIDPGRPITEVPAPPPGHKEVSMQEMGGGPAYLRMLYDTNTDTHLYEVIEPRFSETEQEIFSFLRDTLVRTMAGRRGQGQKEWGQVLEDAVREAIIDHSVIVDEVSTQRLNYHLVREFLGYGPIDVLMMDPMLEDISCDGPGIPLYVYHRTHGSLRTNVVFEDEDALDGFVIRLAQRSGKHISIAEPLLDATLPDGSRLQSTLSREVTTRGSSFTIRKFRADPMSPTDLIDMGTMDSRLGAYFWLLVENGASMIFAGGTASGKTTILNAVSQFIPPERKIVSIEDTREINLNHENWIAGVTRLGFGQASSTGRSAGEVDMYKLLTSALRQRPEYLLVGEVRGPEALTLFQGMATGHTVYSTMHADSASSAVYRLENPPISVPRLMLQTLDMMAIQGQVRVGGRLVRRTLEVTEFVGFVPDTKELLTNTVFRYDPKSGKQEFLGRSDILEDLRRREDQTQQQLAAKWEERVKILDWLHRHGVRDYRRFSHVVSEYYQHPKRVLERVRENREPCPEGPVTEVG